MWFPSKHTPVPCRAVGCPCSQWTGTCLWSGWGCWGRSQSSPGRTPPTYRPPWRSGIQTDTARNTTPGSAPETRCQCPGSVWRNSGFISRYMTYASNGNKRIFQCCFSVGNVRTKFIPNQTLSKNPDHCKGDDSLNRKQIKCMLCKWKWHWWLQNHKAAGQVFGLLQCQRVISALWQLKPVPPVLWLWSKMKSKTIKNGFLYLK